MKGIIMIIDGMGDRPIKDLGYKTPLEAANTPNMDKLAEIGINGIMDPIRPGIRAGSDTSHISILGYDPYEVYTGRGPFEAAGIGLDVIAGDIAFRCNFSTQDENGIIVDRRAGRIREGTEEIAGSINSLKLEGFEDIEIIFKESTGHRAVLVLRGAGLSDKVSDADPKHEGKPPKEVVPLDDSPEAAKTAAILNKFVKTSYDLLKDHPVNLKRINEGENPANVVLPRGVGAVPHIIPFGEKYGVKAACIAETGLIKGIGKITGMDLIDVEGATGGIDTNLENMTASIVEAAKNDDYEFILINIDGADEAGHDGQMEEKVKFIEKVDAVIEEVMKIDDLYFILTADHSTPISVMDHTGDPVPIIIKGPEVKVDNVNSFSERAAAYGGLCRIRGSDIMNILMDFMNKSEKFGA
ncbi:MULTISPECIES: 2,3-bisphosphoglycerate-independent phosphoglycerate mutase [Methanobacterium]|uniref:2,3-bisphosphoglycerate-independent phosphoglycerate mutase n=1 Tax=Methanobacterium veterum TaxID=408577 RepID=A0A9E4ZSN6_9EURY|nr:MULTISPECIES: 2,3-bisphosphoglycerate-independent phosphoglycerate mutase [Methanobacterium]MCZ3364972.1 2,3-bisphosphoglycerate-independent phosphoglycerate mutase [Methanobacterium veterum]MCZ3372727.1 2,3-bisphosphoglycerate-independent phosphoglycerate mutase [Methanobacterium veterum]